MDSQTKTVPIADKYALTIEEAAVYYHIGEGKLRRIVQNNPSSDFVLWNGTRALIKREQFSRLLDRTNAI